MWTETVWLRKLRILTLWSFTEIVCPCLFQNTHRRGLCLPQCQRPQLELGNSRIKYDWSVGKSTHGPWSPIRPMFKFCLCLGIPCMPLTNCLTFPKLNCKMKTLFIVKNYYACKWDNVPKCAVCCQPYSGHLANTIFSLVMSKLRSELQVNAWILPSGQTSICSVEKFFVILAHFHILSRVFGEKKCFCPLHLRSYSRVLPSISWFIWNYYLRPVLSRIAMVMVIIDDFHQLFNGIYAMKSRELAFQKLPCCTAFFPV